ncbi:TetR/AcrR family transcriptional regulator [Nostoc sp. NMS4]|uniref:TetR/AcrR family transcriptional regulator n=1 Tax=Nostoc sp. NMS4 TaxID=2815390 RepID=UPI0025E18F4F|nr:TetR/AcrR family transcriptional regulator [Nostoc sp. NMS4]MBN3923995.1 TetR/AcrR family transcriptional regulator [Nostoc sp. NMS4]
MSNMKIQPDSNYDGQSPAIGNSVSSASALPTKRDRILKAALECFGRYGFKRTAMDDIAKIAGISRAALYLLFQNKEDIFRTLCEDLHGNAIARAQTALQSEIRFRDRLNAAFEGKDLELFELVCDSPHGSELIDLKNAIAADIFLSSSKQFEELLKEAIRQADERGEIELSRGGFQPSNCASLLIGCTQGLKKSSSSVVEYRQQLRHLILIFDLALTASTNNPIRSH